MLHWRAYHSLDDANVATLPALQYIELCWCYVVRLFIETLNNVHALCCYLAHGLLMAHVMVGFTGRQQTIVLEPSNFFSRQNAYAH